MSDQDAVAGVFGARFWAKVVIGEHCWEWSGAHIKTGYPVVTRGGKMLKAHRVAYEACVGPIPSGLVIDHLCRNRGCVRPSHLEAVTNEQNILRGESFSARNAVATHCKNGHPFAGDNVRLRAGRRGRVCVTCQAAWARASRDRTRGLARGVTP